MSKPIQRGSSLDYLRGNVEIKKPKLTIKETFIEQEEKCQ